MGLSSHRALVHLNSVGVHNNPINCKYFSGLNNCNVPYNQIIGTYHLSLPIPDDCHIFLGNLLVEFLELLLFHIVVERTNSNHNHHCKNNGRPLNPPLSEPFCQDSKHQRNNSSSHQDPQGGIFKVLHDDLIQSQRLLQYRFIRPIPVNPLLDIIGSPVYPILHKSITHLQTGLQFPF